MKRATAKAKRALLLLAAASAVALALCAPAVAQTCVSCEDPNPTPTPRATPRPTPSATPRPQGTPSPAATPTAADGEIPGSGIAETLAQIAVESQKALDNAGKLIKLILGDVIWYLAGGLASVMTVLAFTRLVTEDSGNPMRILFLFFRAVACIALFSQVTPILEGFDNTRLEIYEKFKVLSAPVSSAGFDQGRVTPTQLARIKFDLTYKKFCDAYFKELQPNQAPGSDAAKDANGLLWDPNKPWQTNIDRATNPNEWNAPRLYTALTVFRGVFSFMDLAIEIVYNATKLALFLFAPLMFAVAIDKQTFSQTTLPYIRSLFVFYLVWPVVADFIRLLCYMFSTITIEAFMTPVIKRIESTSALGNPVIQLHYVSDFNGYAVIAGCFLMFICSIVLFRSPWIAHRAAAGQVFEAVSSSVASGITTVAGVVMEQFGAHVAAQAENMARMSEIEGQRDASLVGAGARRESGDIGVNSQLVNSRVQALTGYRSTSSGLSADNQRANTMLGAELARTQGTGFASADATIQRTNTGAQMSRDNSDIERQRTEKQANITQSIEGERNFNNAYIDTASGLTNGIPVASGIVGLVAHPVRGSLNSDLIKEQGGLTRQLAGNVQNAQTEVINRNATSNNTITQTEYGRNMEAAAGYTQTGYGANAEYNQTMQGVATTNLNELNSAASQVAGMGHQANAVVYNADVAGAGITFAAGSRAADLHKFSAIALAATRDMDRTMQEALALNY